MRGLIFSSLAVPLLVVATLYAVGAGLPNEGTRFTTAHLSQSPEIVWQVWTDYARSPDWSFGSSSFKKIGTVSSQIRAHHRRWRVTYSSYPSNQSDPRSVDSCDEIIEIEPFRSGTQMTITEKWKTNNPLDKLFRYSVIGYRSHMAKIYETLERQARNIATVQTDPLVF